MGKILYCAWKDQVEDIRDDSSKSPVLPGKIGLPTFLRDKDDLKGFMAWDGFFLSDPNLHIVQLAESYMEHIQSEASCGQCFPCRVGTKIMTETIGRIRQGAGKAEDLSLFESV